MLLIGKVAVQTKLAWNSLTVPASTAVEWFAFNQHPQRLQFYSSHAGKTTSQKWLEWWNKYSRGTAFVLGVSFISAGIAYNEWRKFRQRLSTVPNIFAIEKQVNPFIMVGDYSDVDQSPGVVHTRHRGLFRASLPSPADRLPLTLLRLVRSENELIHQMALHLIVKNSNRWSDSDCLLVAQATDLATAVRLARSKSVDLRLFLKPPRLPTSVKCCEEELRELVAGLPTSDIGPCTRHFTDTALKRGAKKSNASHRDSMWFFDAGEATAFHPHGPPTRHQRRPVDIVALLQALNGHCQIKSHCFEAIQRGSLYVLRHINKFYGDVPTVVHAIARIIASVSVHPELHADLFSAGFVTTLAEWLRSDDLSLSLYAAKTLANMEQERTHSTRHVYMENIFVYHPRFTGDGSPIYADIVFVHGLLGGPFLTWRQQDPVECLPQTGSTASSLSNMRPCMEGDKSCYTDCWPKDWLAEDFPHARQLSVEYDTKLSDWAPKCPYELQRRTLESRGRELLEQLKVAGVGSRPIVWVGHSMGGLLIKQMLVCASEDESTRHLVDRTRGVVFYSVPHDGCSLAEYSMRPAAYLLYPSVEVRELKRGSENLRSLHDKFSSLMLSTNARLVSFAEGESTDLPLKFKATIVPQESSDPGFGEFYLMPGLNHLNICKPAHRTSPLYVRTLRFINKCLSPLDTSLPVTD